MSKICAIPLCCKPVHGWGWCRKHYLRYQRNGDPLKLVKTERGLMLKWIKDHTDHVGAECLTWPFARKAQGYGLRMVWDKKEIAPHRLMCIIVHGQPPTSRYDAAHSCGNGHLGCVNPQHLRWATRTENAADMVIHGTQLRGERSPSAKLTEEQVLAIRAASGLHKTIAASYGVTRRTIGDIKSRRNWSWL